MIKITIDCNSDEIKVEGNDVKEKVFKIKYPSEFIPVIEGIIGSICTENPIRDIQLTRIDEDRETTIGEW